ncbi:hypothetical protein [Roseobacter sinensis]|uniref:Primosomal protein N' (Replication factor Y)-superfamily II helicase n=1 Tax=Roseobacter sinensis TaxID=2931391 RepID=A0ABT3BCT7_9RHOB|nr:hypothetical protein [Roseobacter sp. WL0113]MCV3270953.1 hypothetical protein [Roseobacter sp. WL0113]
MTEAAAIQTALQCPACAGQCTFLPTEQALACQSCGSTHPIELDDDADAAAETPYGVDLVAEDRPVPQQVRVHHCETCGGDVIFTGPILSERCAYCDGPVVLALQDTGFATMGLIPFAIGEEEAQACAQRWVSRRIAAPSDLKGIIAEARVAGLYAPFWTFDSTETIRYWAQYRTGSGNHARTRSTEGDMEIVFDDLLMPASPHVTPLIRDGILHEFDPARLRPYDAAYLAGFAAEQHHQTVEEGLAANADDKDLLIRNRIRKHIDKSRIVSLEYQSDTTGIHYRRILLPVWILHYSYEDQPMKVVVCGLHGRTFGERPFSTWKLAGYAAVLSAVAIGFGVGWGAGGLL